MTTRKLLHALAILTVAFFAAQSRWLAAQSVPAKQRQRRAIFARFFDMRRFFLQCRRRSSPNHRIATGSRCPGPGSEKSLQLQVDRFSGCKLLRCLGLR